MLACCCAAVVHYETSSIRWQTKCIITIFFVGRIFITVPVLMKIIHFSLWATVKFKFLLLINAYFWSALASPHNSTTTTRNTFLYYCFVEFLCHSRDQPRVLVMPLLQNKKLPNFIKKGKNLRKEKSRALGFFRFPKNVYLFSSKTRQDTFCLRFL